MSGGDRANRIATLSARFMPVDVDDLAGARSIKTTLLSPNPFQPRTHFDPLKLQELASSITRRQRVLQPLLVRETPGKKGEYQIAAGERRWRAAQLALLDTVPCIVDDLDDDAMEEIALTENIQREDLTDIELAHAFKRLLERHPELSMRALSEQLGKNHSYVEDKLKIIADPRIAAAVESGALGPSVAAALTNVDDEAARSAMLERAHRGERIKVKDVRALRTRPTPTAVPEKPAHTSSTSLPEKPAGIPSLDGLTEALTDGSPVVVPEKLATVSMSTVSDTMGMSLRDLRIIQLYTAGDGDPRQRDMVDPTMVLRILEVDLTWLKDRIRRAHDSGDGQG